MSRGFVLDAIQDATDDGSPSRNDKRLQALLDQPSFMRDAECAAAICRQFIARSVSAMNDPLVQAFEEVFPRTDSSVTSKGVLIKVVGLAASEESLLEQVAANCLANYATALDDPNVSAFRSLPQSTQARELAVSLLKQHTSLRAAPRLTEEIERVLPKSRGVSVSKLNTLLSLVGAPRVDGSSVLEFVLNRDIENTLACGIVDSVPSGHFEFNGDNSSVDINGFRVADSSDPSAVVASLDEIDMSQPVDLGHGAGGCVIRAFHPKTGAYVAVKQIRLSENAMQQAQAEMLVVYGTAKDQATSSCISLITCYGVFYRSLELFIVLELMSGSLKSLMGKKHLGEQDIAAIVFQSLHGLRFLHEVKKQMHRDLKPHNILYRTSDGLVKLTDFGIASRKMESVNFGKFETQVGTLAYLSPKRVASESAPYGPESDIWSFGVTVLELALGRLPFPPNPFAIGQLANNPPRLPPTSPLTGEPFSPAFSDFVAQCLMMEPPSAAQLSQHPFVVGMDWDRSRQIVSALPA
jgi:hypothetical protein